MLRVTWMRSTYRRRVPN